MAKRKRGKRRENRHERRQQQHSGGGGWSCLALPEGLTKFKPKAGNTYHIDVIPYNVGEYNKNADKGDEYFELSYAVYNDLGIEEKRFIAIGEMLGVKDPVAEHFAALRKQGNEWKDMSDFSPKWRQLMLVFVHEQADQGLQIFEGAYGTMGKLLDAEIKAVEADYVDNFDDTSEGSTLEVRFVDENIGMKNPWTKAEKINFFVREDGFDANGDAKLAEEILDKVAEICLDDCLKITDYTTLKNALDGVPSASTDDPEDEPEDNGDGLPFDGTGPDGGKKGGEEPGPEEDKTEEKPKAKAKAGGKRKPPTAKALGIVKGGDVEHDDFGVCTVIRIAKDGLTVVIMDEDDGVHPGIDPTDLEPVKSCGGQGSEPEEKAEKPTEPESGGGDNSWDKDW